MVASVEVRTCLDVALLSDLRIEVDSFGKDGELSVFFVIGEVVENWAILLVGCTDVDSVIGEMLNFLVEGSLNENFGEEVESLGKNGGLYVMLRIGKMVGNWALVLKGFTDVDKYFGGVLVVVIEDGLDVDIKEDVNNFGIDITLSFLLLIGEIVVNWALVKKGFTDDVDVSFGEVFVVAVEDRLGADVDEEFDSFGKDWGLFVLLIVEMVGNLDLL